MSSQLNKALGRLDLEGQKRVTELMDQTARAARSLAITFRQRLPSSGYEDLKGVAWETLCLAALPEYFDPLEAKAIYEARLLAGTEDEKTPEQVQKDMFKAYALTAVRHALYRYLEKWGCFDGPFISIDSPSGSETPRNRRYVSEEEFTGYPSSKEVLMRLVAEAFEERKGGSGTTATQLVEQTQTAQVILDKAFSTEGLDEKQANRQRLLLEIFTRHEKGETYEAIGQNLTNKPPDWEKEGDSETLSYARIQTLYYEARRRVQYARVEEQNRRPAHSALAPLLQTTHGKGQRENLRNLPPEKIQAIMTKAYPPDFIDERHPDARPMEEKLYRAFKLEGKSLEDAAKEAGYRNSGVAKRAFARAHKRVEQARDRLGM